MTTAPVAHTEPRGSRRARRYAVVGGGASGALLAIAAAGAASPRRVALSVFEPREQLGQGLAYSSRRAEHLLNVPAGRLSALADEPADFVGWCRAHGIIAHPHSFLERRHFGAYLQNRVWDRAARAAVDVEHVRARVVDVVARDGGYVVCTGDGRRREVDGVVLATGYGLVPGNALFASAESPLVVRDPYAPDAFSAFANDGVVVVLGTGLTAVDAILSLAAERPGQAVLAVSRRGLLPCVHDLDVEPIGRRLTSRSARGLVHELRQAARDVEMAGGDWRAVIDGVRPQLPDVWRTLPPDERRRFLRVARRLWEVHRHRLPPDVASTLERLGKAGQLEIRRATPVDVDVTAVGVDVTVRQQASRSCPERVRAAGVVLCTGTIDGDWTTTSPLLGTLLTRGLISADPVAIGPVVERCGRLVNAQGEPQTGLWAIGPLRRAAEWEATAIPEIGRQAAQIAAQL